MHRTIVRTNSGDRSHAVAISCDEDEPVVERDLGDGRKVTIICQTAISAKAVQGMRTAREAVANNPDIPQETREEILRSLDAEIDAMADRQPTQVSYRYRSSKGQRHAPASAMARSLRITASIPVMRAPLNAAAKAQHVETRAIRLSSPLRAAVPVGEQCPDESPSGRTA